MDFRIAYILFLFVVLNACAQTNSPQEPRQYIAYKTSETIKVDGEETETSWEKIEWSNPFIDIQGVKIPKYKTQVKMLWDDTYFYILAKLEEPHVWGHLVKRDTIIFHNNDFEVFIDPDGDSHNYYELEINALNTVWDLFVSKPYRSNNVVLNDWDITDLKSAVKINGTINNPNDIDKGWVLEIAIPWKAYKKGYFHKNVPIDAFWRVNFSRVNWDFQFTDGKYELKKDDKGKLLHEYNWVWSPQGVINMHEPEKWGYVYFSSKEVGEQEDFVIPNDEKIKWKLFEYYRAQKNYFDKNEKWATAIDSLKIEPLKIENKIIEPTLENHSQGWNIIVKSPFSGKQMIIKEDSKYIEK
ncbi:carbohydrate-binding family 9-like protein [Seonamhaeicola sp. MEBiC1930]|uniref:carbohydrate-binding family 9-like protein n=1 Tax=Seonamhaeicola sp. MEBiC01930 TaxID=2976768 RepID=UPI00324F10C3